MKSGRLHIPEGSAADQCLSLHGDRAHEQLAPRLVTRRETRPLPIELALRPGVELTAVGEGDVHAPVLLDVRHQTVLLQPRSELLARTVVRLAELGKLVHRPFRDEKECPSGKRLACHVAGTVRLGHDDLHRVVYVGEKLHLEPPWVCRNETFSLPR